MSELLVSMEGIDRSFPGVRALDRCRFELRAGEVHALVGENGAGKSTLMKVLAGVSPPDAGRIEVKGAEVAIATPRAAQALGISMIHQELNLLPHLTVAQNIFIGHEPRRRVRFLLDERAIVEKARALLERLHLAIDPRARVADLTVARQQMVEIAKALSQNADVLIMDEPTAALAEAEIGDLFRIIRQLCEKGAPDHQADDLIDGGVTGGQFVIGHDAGKPQKAAVRKGIMAGAVSQDPVGIGYNIDAPAMKPLLYD